MNQQQQCGQPHLTRTCVSESSATILLNSLIDIYTILHCSHAHEQVTDALARSQLGKLTSVSTWFGLTRPQTVQYNRFKSGP